MVDLLFWFLVSQTISGLPNMAPGTEVRIVSLDLLTIYASAVVEDNELVFHGNLQADSEVRVLIMVPDATPKEAAEALSNKAMFARISPEGDDILLQFKELHGALSFKKWLLEERGIILSFHPNSSTPPD
jgi:hypothetical protein